MSEFLSKQEERSFKFTPFEYAGHNFKLVETYKKGSNVCDMIVEAETEDGVKFLEDKKYAHNAFIIGRGVWLLKRKQELEELRNVKFETTHSKDNS